ncbi:hypothetical protein EK21DRAFT_113366 [Setomelanomma holmii]|uniref:Uncharacterized protein n=1 Tax=Setomelanomma holmii TaxID=210430 RepID=A0A9P4H877_9PLEO|nr:hypothetical protein EK21DRAFT_113366 [Setomelanomma holmii]
MLRDSQNHSTLEPVPKSEVASSYIFSVPDDSPLQVNNQIPWTENTQNESNHTPAHVAPTKPTLLFLRWPFLALYAILIAIIAGLAGGFIGEDITTKRLSTSSIPKASIQSYCSTPSSTPTTSPSLTTSTPTSASASIFERTIAQPTTGCVPTTQQKSFKSVTKFLAAQYTTYCATGWLNDELFALSAASASDCVEACVMYNGHKQSSDRTCVGGGFIPEWWNQSRAMDESGGMPYNCFLKSNDSGTGRNEKNVEVVSLCLADACKDVLSGS